MRLPRGKNYQESVFGVNAPNQSFPSQCWWSGLKKWWCTCTGTNWQYQPKMTRVKVFICGTERQLISTNIFSNILGQGANFPVSCIFRLIWFPLPVSLWRHHDRKWKNKDRENWVLDSSSFVTISGYNGPQNAPRWWDVKTAAAPILHGFASKCTLNKCGLHFIVRFPQTFIWSHWWFLISPILVAHRTICGVIPIKELFISWKKSNRLESYGLICEGIYT
jgi:hypothetical protein